MLELPVDPPVDAMSSEHQLAAEAGVPPLLSLRSWWMSALVELGRSQLSNVAFMSEALPQLLPQILPAGSTYTDGTVVMSLDPEVESFDVNAGSIVSLDVRMGEIRISGLDAISEVDLLQVIGDYTVSNTLTFDRLDNLVHGHN